MTGYQSFRVGSDTSNHHLKIRVFPQHNDVALKVWEAGACLAEYLMAYPDMVANKRVIELGAGVGLTGLVMAACCQPISVYMTDYSATCLENMNHNIAINQKWIQHCRGALGNHEDVVTWVSNRDDFVFIVLYSCSLAPVRNTDLVPVPGFP
jgi:predicted nicotinamide N-methyase